MIHKINTQVHSSHTLNRLNEIKNNTKKTIRFQISNDVCKIVSANGMLLFAQCQKQTASENIQFPMKAKTQCNKWKFRPPQQKSPAQKKLI